jgi:hypothetical protein
MIVVFLSAALSSLPAMAQEPTPAAAPGAAPAAAPPGEAVAPFGVAGQIAVSSDLQLQISHSGLGGASTDTVRIQPAFDYFVIPAISVGGALGLEFDWVGAQGITPSSRLTTIVVQARAGYVLRLLDNVAVWGRIGLSYAHQSQSGGTSNATAYAIPFSLSVPVLWMPTSHLFIGAGPFFDRDIVSKVGSTTQPNHTDFGIQSIVGGYFGGG